MPVTDLAITEWDPESVAPDPLDEIAHSADELGALDFADLPRQRVEPPPLPDALLNVHALRSQYQQARTDYAQLRDRVRIGDGPAMREAGPRITRPAQARRRRPALSARSPRRRRPVGRRRGRPTPASLPASNGPANNSPNSKPSPTPIPTTSPQRNSTCAGAPWNCPRSRPPNDSSPRCIDALAARAAAAGGAEHIISGDDVDKLIADVMGEDDRAVAAARQRAPICAATSTAPNSSPQPLSPQPKSAPPSTSPRNSTNSTPSCASSTRPAATNHYGPCRSPRAP